MQPLPTPTEILTLADALPADTVWLTSINPAPLAASIAIVIIIVWYYFWGSRGEEDMGE